MNSSLDTMPERLVVGVDGLSASGKSSIASAIAAAFKFESLSFPPCSTGSTTTPTSPHPTFTPYIDSGALYCAMAYLAIHQHKELGIIEAPLPADFKEKIVEVIETFNKEISATNTVSNDAVPRVSFNVIFHGLDITRNLGQDKVKALASKIAGYKEVREAIDAKEHEIFKHEIEQVGAVVRDGRATKSLYPDAFMLWAEADLKDRAERRLRQQGRSFNDRALSEMKAKLTERDERDSNRAIAPTKMPPDALVLNTSKHSLKECLEIVRAYKDGYIEREVNRRLAIRRAFEEVRSGRKEIQFG